MSDGSEIIQSPNFAPNLTRNNPSAEYQNLQNPFKFNDLNYLVWSQLVRTSLKGKGKPSHLIILVPSEDDSKFIAWDKEDSMIMSWLWNSMQPEISGLSILLKTARDIWETVRQSYSKMRDAIHIYEIKTKIGATKQGTMEG